MLKLARWVSGRVRHPSCKPGEQCFKFGVMKARNTPVTELRLWTRLHEGPACISGKIEDRTDLLRDLLILVKLVGHDNEMWAALLGLSNEHAGSDAKLASLIIS